MFKFEGYYIYILLTDVSISKCVYTVHLDKLAGNESSQIRQIFVDRNTVTRQATYVWPNNEAFSWKHCCGGKAKSIAYSVCVFIDLGIQHAMRMYHIFICGLFEYQNVVDYLIKDSIFEKKNYLNKMRNLILSTTFLWSIFHYKKNWARYDKICTLVFV